MIAFEMTVPRTPRMATVREFPRIGPEADLLAARLVASAERGEGLRVVVPAELHVGFDLCLGDDVPVGRGPDGAEFVLEALADVPGAGGDGVDDGILAGPCGKARVVDVLLFAGVVAGEDPHDRAGLGYREVERHLGPLAVDRRVEGLRDEGDGKGERLLDRLQRRTDEPDKRGEERRREEDEERVDDDPGGPAAAFRAHIASSFLPRESRAASQVSPAVMMKRT
jgi:hypothetical protein